MKASVMMLAYLCMWLVLFLMLALQSFQITDFYCCSLNIFFKKSKFPLISGLSKEIFSLFNTVVTLPPVALSNKHILLFLSPVSFPLMCFSPVKSNCVKIFCEI